MQRFEKKNTVVNLGRAEAILPLTEQIPKETYRRGSRIRALIIDVKRTQKDPQIILSRSDPSFLVKLFEQEVPEIAEGIVKIMCAGRRNPVKGLKSASGLLMRMWIQLAPV